MQYLYALFLAALTMLSCASRSHETQIPVPKTGEVQYDDAQIEVPAGQDSVHMVFDLKNQPAGQTKLVGMFEDQYFFVDSAQIDANGHFEIKRQKLLPRGFYYFILPGQKHALHLLLDRDQRFSFSADARAINATAQVEGSTTLALFYDNAVFQEKIEQELRKVAPKLQNPPDSPEFKQAKARYDELMRQLDARLRQYEKKHPNNFFVKFKIAGQNPKLTYPLKPDGTLDTARQAYLYRIHFWDGFDFREKDLLRTPVYVNKMEKFFMSLVPFQQDSIIKYTDMLVEKAGDNFPYFRAITNWVARKFEPGHTKLMDGEAVFSHIVLKYFTPDKATWAKPEEIEKLRKRASEMTLSLLRKPAQNVIAKDYTGQTKALLDIKSPYIAVLIYSPDCEHCQKEIPILVGMYSQLKKRGLEVFSIATNTNEKDWRAFHKKLGIPWIDIFDPTNASWYPKYFVDITPEIYLIDRDRKIAYKNLKVDQLSTVLDRLEAKEGK